MTARALVLAVSLACLSACTATAPRATLPPDRIASAEAEQVAREAALREQSAWSLQGRIAVANQGKGGSGRIDWRQEGARYQVALSAPVTRQSWRLSGDGDGARLEGIEGGPREGSDAAQLLREATGWEIPVAALAEWVRGARAPGLGPARVAYGVDGRLAHLEQGGWAIDYVWNAMSADPVLPARLTARRGEAQVRLIIDRWGDGVIE
ncbi:lipoprotein insertase outer membrane protein LolB [Lysobacter niastensis]|uniref:Outer-membrane lipoprotein LolB n=1 Tax=Lysobacter niastensis TaxID=380629 RepID=A0ABS0B9V0_9GAMM|nr:lipoprotein insertase outer membrane protein LolB [Lysobacter niastensis]MBF6025783.1 outer membrane lipoprotein LolB [Lysobacter niastensis]